MLDALNNVMEGVFLAQNAVRGYVLTGNPVVLDSFRTGRRQFENSIGRIRQLASDNPSQQRRLFRTGA